MQVTTEPRYQSWKASRPVAQPESGKTVFFMLALFTVILFGRPTDLFNLRLPIAAVVAIAAIIAFFAAKMSGRLPWVLTIEVKLVFAMTAWFILGVPFSIWRSGALTTLTETWFKTVIIFFLLSQTVCSIPRVRTLVMIIVWCEFVISGYSIVYWRLHGGGAMDERFYGETVGFVSGNYLGIAAAITFPYMILLLTRRPGIFRSLLLLSTMGFMMWMAVLTASRGGFLTLALSLFLTWLILLGRARARSVGVIFVLGAVLAAGFAPQTFWDRMGTFWKSSHELQSETATSASESTQQREQALRNSIKWTLENPIFGLGVGNFHVKSGEVGGAHSWIGTHNGFTQISSEAGIPALLMFIGLLLIAAKRMYTIGKAPKDEPRSNELAMWARATLIAILSFMFGSFFAHLSYDYYVYYLIGIGIAIQMVYQRDFHLGPQPAKSARVIQVSPGS